MLRPMTGENPRELEIAALLRHADAGPVARLDADRVAAYVRAGDAVPPIVVYDTPEGPLIADGHHRLAAALERGRTTIAADFRAGTRRDALRYAALTAAAQRGIPVADALERIRLHSGDRWGRPDEDDADGAVR
jgi:ParB-like chromosome segregation protein Spo0J